MDIVIRLIIGIIVAAVIVWLLGGVIGPSAIVYLIALLVFLVIVFGGIAIPANWRR